MVDFGFSIYFLSEPLILQISLISQIKEKISEINVIRKISDSDKNHSSRQKMDTRIGRMFCDKEQIKKQILFGNG
jgi:hypothetical protein